MKKRLMNNLGLKLLAFLFAFMLWIGVMNQDNPITEETFDDIPVIVEHAEIITQSQKSYQIIEDTETVSVTVSAKRSELEKIKAENIIVTADMKEMYLESQIPVSVSIPGIEYESAVASPRNIQVKIENNKSNSFPITVTTTGAVRDGYVLGTVEADPEGVVLNGPETMIENISKVVAEVDVSGLSKDSVLDAAVVCYDKDNNRISSDQLTSNLGTEGVKVRVTLYRTENVPVTVDTSWIEAADGYSVAEVSWSPQEIKVAGDDDALNRIEEIRIPAKAAAVSGVAQKTEKTIDVTPYLPEGIKLAEEGANNILVTIRVQKDGTKNIEIPVGSITVKNLNENLTMSYLEGDNLEIHLTGRQEVLDLLDADVIAGSVSIDLAKYREAGEYEVPVALEVPEGCKLDNTLKVRIILEKKETSDDMEDSE